MRSKKTLTEKEWKNEKWQHLRLTVESLFNLLIDFSAKDLKKNLIKIDAGSLNRWVFLNTLAFILSKWSQVYMCCLDCGQMK